MFSHVSNISDENIICNSMKLEAQPDQLLRASNIIQRTVKTLTAYANKAHSTEMYKPQEKEEM